MAFTEACLTFHSAVERGVGDHLLLWMGVSSQVLRDLTLDETSLDSAIPRVLSHLPNRHDQLQVWSV